MDDEQLDEGAQPYVQPSEIIRIRESHAKDVLEKGLQSLTRLEGFVRYLSSTLLDVSVNLKTICLEEEQRSQTAMLDLSPGAPELWTVLQSLTMLLSESQEKTSSELVCDFLKPLEEMHTRLRESRRSIDLLKRNRKFDIMIMEAHVEKEKKACLKAMKSLQSSVKSLVESTNSNGIFSKMTRRRYEKTVKKKILEVQDLFRKYQSTINAYNRQFEEYERMVQTPLLNNIGMLEGKRLELLKRCTINLEIYLSTITTPEQATSVLMKNALDSINEAREMSTTPSAIPEHKLQFVYDLPCPPEAFDYNTWPESSGLVWYKGSVHDASKRKDSIDRRGTMPDIRANARNVWAISQSGDSDHEFDDDLKTIEEDNVEPKPVVASFSLVKPKSAGNWHEGQTSAKPSIWHANAPEFRKESDLHGKTSFSFKPHSKQLPEPGKLPSNATVTSKPTSDNLSDDLSHLTLNRPVLQRPRQRRPPGK